ncbi:unnamed protein product, partial [Allacma fusca]
NNALKKIFSELHYFPGSSITLTTLDIFTPILDSFNYPYQPPMCTMLTKVVHPSVSRHGEIGLTLLQKGLWTPCNTVRSILIAIHELLSSSQSAPILQKESISLEPSVSDLCAANYPKFCSLAKDWTAKFAKHYE